MGRPRRLSASPLICGSSGRNHHVHEGALALEDAGRRHREHGRHAGAGPLLELGGAEVEVLRGHEVRPQQRRALHALVLFERAARRRCAATTAAPPAARARRSCGTAAQRRAVGHVDEARVDVHVRAVDRDRVNRRRHVRADILNQPVANHDRGAGNGRAGRRKDASALDGVRNARLPCGPDRSERQRRRHHRRAVNEEKSRPAHVLCSALRWRRSRRSASLRRPSCHCWRRCHYCRPM